jgi:hypothetical protein
VLKIGEDKLLILKISDSLEYCPSEEEEEETKALNKLEMNISMQENNMWILFSVVKKCRHRESFENNNEYFFKNKEKIKNINKKF